LQKSAFLRLPRRFTPRNNSKDAICHCEQSDRLSGSAGVESNLAFLRLLQEPQKYFIKYNIGGKIDERH